MKVGFLTVALGNVPFEEKIKWAQKQGFSGVEVACWPRENTRDYASCDIDVGNMSAADADKIRRFLDDKNVEITSLAYYDNNLHSDLDIRKRINSHLYRCIDAAEALGVPYVGTFTGRNEKKSIRENFDEFEKVFLPVLEYAQKKKVGIIIENCQMEGWQKPGLPGTISYSPELWDEMFRRVPCPNFGLNFDPSHLLIMGIDYIPLISTYRKRIFHVHAKDAYVNKTKYQYYGCFNRQLDRELTNGYWECRIPGRGQVDFTGVISALNLIGYQGPLSIEHEDLLYEGTYEKVTKGLLQAKGFLDNILDMYPGRE